MNKILVIDDEEGIRDVLVMILECRFDYPIIEAASGNKGIEILKNDPSIGLVLCDFRMDDGNGGDVFLYMKEHCSHIPYILVSTDTPKDHEIFNGFLDSNHKNSNITKPFDSAGIIELVAKSYIEQHEDQSIQDTETHRDEDNYKRVGSERFMKYPSSSAVYIQLSDKKFVKIRESEDQDKESIGRYFAKGVKFFYLREEDYSNFFQGIMEKIFQQLSDPSLPTSQIDELHIESIEHIHSSLKNMGMNENSIIYTDKIINSTLEGFKKIKGTSHLFDIINNLSGYIYKHSHLTSYFACAIAQKVEWGSEQMSEKLVFASLFQNVDFDDNDLAKVFKVDDIFFNALTLAERNSIRGHMGKAVELIKSHPSFSGELQSIILNHHEQPDGSGFPRGLDSIQIGAVDALFILALNFAHELIMGGDDSSERVKQVIKSFEQRYSRGRYKQPFEALVKVFN